MSVLWLTAADVPRDARALLDRIPATDLRIQLPESAAELASFPRTVAAQVRGRIFRLIRVVSHGSSGRLQILGQLRSAYELRPLFAPFRALVPSMPYATVHFHGCGVASASLPPPRLDSASMTGQTEYRPGLLLDPMNAWPSAFGPGTVGGGSGPSGPVTGMPGPGVGQQASATMRAWLRQSRGYDFLRVAALEFDAGVKGAVDYQEVDPAWEYEGPTLTVWPNRLQRPVLLDPRNRFGWGERVEF